MSDPYWLSDEGPLTPETRERLLAHVRESGFDAEEQAARMARLYETGTWE